MPKVSIIIPIYNVEKYLAKCLDSVLNQTYKNIEIICIDDCGKDNSINILKQYKDNRIKIIKHEQNKGLAIARNTGIKNATGDYIYFLDSDDYIYENTISDLLNIAIENNSDITFSLSEDHIILNKQKPIIVKKSVNLKEKKFIVNKENFLFCLKTIPCVSWNKLLKKSFLLDNNIYFIEKNIPHEDIGFFMKLLSNFPKISFINKIHHCYLKRKYSIMYSARKSLYKQKENKKIVVDDACNYIKNTGKDKELINIIKKLYAKLYHNEIFYLPVILIDVLRNIIKIKIVNRKLILLALFGIKIYEK